MTWEQRQRLINRLKGRNLPLDLFVEIEDHMSEQIDYKMHFGNKNFDSAFDQTFAEWSSELEMKSVFWAGEKRTKIHRQTINQTQKNLFLRSLKYFVRINFSEFGLVIGIFFKNQFVDGNQFHLSFFNRNKSVTHYSCAGVDSKDDFFGCH